jgi:hypothetical protein
VETVSRDAGGQPPDPRDLSHWAINRMSCMRGLLVGVVRAAVTVAAEADVCGLPEFSTIRIREPVDGRGQRRGLLACRALFSFASAGA